ncbi:low-density lipoprotein receptor 2-like [Macrosteles quadrilineatus]|uniref:low-density lipoprotein receptor 2-like n=1 Tax=Macrosteles quadrilineatus TaxID=74068 RepID=UPI0023E0E538|nr:low-density lipoprotein receptor 2-like [Macrosteles quadrilineatus]
MCIGRFLLEVSLIAAVAAHHTVLIANQGGVHAVDPISQNVKTLLEYEKGANTVTYSLQTENVYGIFQSQNPFDHKIVRTKIVDKSEPCNVHNLEEWCRRSKLCFKVCKSDNPYMPFRIKFGKCLKASNLVLDWINDNLYWTCEPNGPEQKSSLNVMDVDDKHNKTLLTKSNPIQSIDVDPYEKKLFVLESNVLTTTTLEGGNETMIYQFDDGVENISKITLDTDSKIVYVVGKSLNNSNDRFLARLNYDGTDYKKLYTSSDPAWQFGPKIVNKVVYWLTNSNNTEWQAVGEADVKMEKLLVPLGVVQWSLVHIDAQKPLNSSHCRLSGCSHGCTISSWMKVACQCPDDMILAEDNKTCNVIPGLQITTQKTVETPRTNESQGNREFVNGSGDLAESAVNVTDDYTHSAGETSQNATVTAGAVTASSSSMTLFYIVITTIFVSVFIVVIAVKRRAKIGKYQPADSQERTDFSL